MPRPAALHPPTPQRRLIRASFIALVACVGIGAYFSYQVLRNAIRANLEQNALSEVEDGTDEIDTWLATHKTRVEMIAHTKVARTTDWPSLLPYLQTEQARIGSFDALGLALPDGTRYSTIAAPTNVRDRQWFQNAMSGQIMVNNPVVSRGSGQPIIPISAPIYGNIQAGESPRGVILGSINVDRIQQIVQERKFGKNSYAFLLSSTGQPIVHPQTEFMSTLEKPTPSLTEATEPGLAKAARQMIAHQRKIELIQINSQPFYIAYVPLKQADWSIALVIPQENIDRQLHLLDGIAIVVLGLSAALGIVLVHLQSTATAKSKQLEAEAARQALEHRVIERTQTLNQTLEQLKESQVQLVQSEKMSALGNLVAGVAHEINNPIGFLVGNIEPAQNYIRDLFELLDLYQTQYPEDNRVIKTAIETIDLDYIRMDLPKVIGSMQVGADRISEISNSLRTFSRADNDALVTFNLHDGLDSTILILKHRLKANEHRPAIAIQKHYGELPPVIGYAGQLNQVFMNILANAIDALEESSAQRDYADMTEHPNVITITTELDTIAQPTNQPTIVVRIRDNGIGMTEAVKAKIFEHLFTLKPVGKGTGLGLAIVQQIIAEKHGGSIQVNSEPGAGTEFVIRLPQTIAPTMAYSPG